MLDVRLRSCFPDPTPCRCSTSPWRSRASGFLFVSSCAQFSLIVVDVNVTVPLVIPGCRCNPRASSRRDLVGTLAVGLTGGVNVAVPVSFVQVIPPAAPRATQPVRPAAAWLLPGHTCDLAHRERSPLLAIRCIRCSCGHDRTKPYQRVTGASGSARLDTTEFSVDQSSCKGWRRKQPRATDVCPPEDSYEECSSGRN